ncbi:hypothetical protein BZG01_10880 [Labilibaculum manganireducens]|uniref:6-bladed beta-propeller n=1 Tax=Labilibaculum manganireducens TaxID=1940525 RepID=A0A2N3I885_9BACT|nr:6-bladed beta-propeller [Labilibaculum manganireducens]PKQ66521.1 hypothetical protein BZG01_10880 [Labilibaculum manganireducens]
MNKVFIMCSLIFLSSCLNSEEKVNDLLVGNGTVDVLKNIGDVKKLSIQIDRVIPLETSDSCIIGSISKIDIDHGDFLILDRWKSKSVFWFSGQGEFRNKINTIGKAEGEYLGLEDFLRNSNGKEYLLYDRTLSKLLTYNNKRNFVKEASLNKQICNIVNTTSSDFLIQTTSGEDFLLELWDQNFIKKHEFLHRPEYVKNYFMGAEFTLKKDNTNTISFCPPFSNIIYKWKNEKMAVSYAIKNIDLFPNKAFFDKYKGRHPSLLLEEIKKQKYINFLDFIENSDVLILKYYRGEQKTVTLFNKHSETSVSYKVGNSCIANLIFNSISVTEGGQFISYIFPYQINSLSNNNVLMEHVSVSFSENNNPYIVYLDVAGEE